MSKSGDLTSKIKEAVATLDVDGLRMLLREAFSSGFSGMDIVSKGISKGIKLSGDVGLIVAADILKREVDRLLESEKIIEDNSTKKFSGKVVIGTVKGDTHDIGKNIVVALMGGSGITVEDLGVDIPAKVFVEKAKLADVKVIALSCLLTSTISSVKQTILEIEKAGIRNKVKIIIGGTGISIDNVKELKADAYAKNATVGVDIIKKWMLNHENNKVK